MLYKPSGFPSFEIISYILDSDLSNVELVMDAGEIKIHKHFACGDIKEIYSNLLLR